MGSVGEVASQSNESDANKASPQDVASIADAVRQPIFRLNAQGRIVFANAYLVEFCGHTPDHRNILHPEDEEAFWRDVATHESRSSLVRLRRCDGTYRSHRIDLSPQPDGGCIVVGRDVENDHRLTEALNAASVATLEWNPGNQAVEWSEPARAILGTEPPGTMSEWLDSIHPEDRRLVENELERCVSGTCTIEVELRYLHPSEGERWLLLVGRMVQREGIASHMVGILQDITHRRLPQELVVQLNEQLELTVAEQIADLRIANGELVARMQEKERIEAALRRSEEWFRLVADTLPHMVWSATPDGRYVFGNKRHFEFLGIATPGESHRLSDHVHPEDAEEMIARWSEALGTGEPYEAEYRLRRHDGVFRWVMARALPQRDEEGKIVRWFGSCTDIEDRKHLEVVAFAEKERLQLALEMAQAGSWEYEAATRSTLWSDEMYDLHGMSRTDADPGIECYLAMHPQDRQRVKRAIAAVSRGAPRCEFEYRMMHPDRGTRWLRARGIALYDSSGKAARTVGITEDLTDQKQAEAELERRVSERTRELEAFTYTVSHDLRAPLRALISTSRILLDEAGPKLSSQERRLLERQEFNASRLGTLIDELLQLTRISRQPLNRIEIDLTELAHNLAGELLLKTWPEQLYVEIEESLTCLGDVALIRYALHNLLENAFKFSPKGGTIKVYKLDEAICVEDEGIGFDPQYAQKVFLPFERLVRDEEYPGTGIGLAMVKRIIERHEGTIWAQSEPKKGSRFSFTLGTVEPKG